MAAEDLKLGGHPAAESGPGAGRLWPSEEYARQVERLRSAIGQRIYLVEVAATDINLGVRLSDRAYELLGVVEFPRPDPLAGLAPHLVLLDDGRGLNLGRIARISVRRPFGPTADDVLYQDSTLTKRLLFQDRSLTKALIAERSRELLGDLLGRRPVARIGDAGEDGGPSRLPPGRRIPPAESPINLGSRTSCHCHFAGTPGHPSRSWPPGRPPTPWSCPAWWRTPELPFPRRR